MEEGRREGSRKILWKKEGGKEYEDIMDRGRWKGEYEDIMGGGRREGRRKILWKEEDGRE